MLGRYGNRHVDGEDAVFECRLCLVDLNIVRNRHCTPERAIAAFRTVDSASCLFMLALAFAAEAVGSQFHFDIFFSKTGLVASVVALAVWILRMDGVGRRRDSLARHRGDHTG